MKIEVVKAQPTIHLELDLTLGEAAELARKLLAGFSGNLYVAGMALARAASENAPESEPTKVESVFSVGDKITTRNEDSDPGTVIAVDGVKISVEWDGAPGRYYYWYAHTLKHV